MGETTATVFCEVCNIDVPQGDAEDASERRGGCMGQLWICKDCLSCEPCEKCGGEHRHDAACPATEAPSAALRAMAYLSGTGGDPDATMAALRVRGEVSP